MDLLLLVPPALMGGTYAFATQANLQGHRRLWQLGLVGCAMNFAATAVMLAVVLP